MKLAMLFGVLAALFLGAWVVMYALMVTYPIIGLFLSIPMMIAGWGGGIFIILAIVMLVLRR